MLDYEFHISTARLTISYGNPDNDKHCDFVCELNSSPEILVAHCGRPNATPDRESARESIKQSAAMLEKTGYGRYMISRKPSDSQKTTEDDNHTASFSDSINTHDLIGRVSMNCGRFPNASTVPDVGFAIMAKYYGKGYATEAARGLMKYYREEKGQTQFAGYCDPTNENSKKMFARLGFDERGVKLVHGIRAEGVETKCLVFTTGVKGEMEGMRNVDK